MLRTLLNSDLPKSTPGVAQSRAAEEASCYYSQAAATATEPADPAYLESFGVFEAETISDEEDEQDYREALARRKQERKEQREQSARLMRELTSVLEMRSV